MADQACRASYQPHAPSGVVDCGMAAKRRPEGMPRVTQKNIYRAEKNACGRRVHCKRQRREYVKYCPDGWEGPFESLRAAIAWRDELWARLGPLRTCQRLALRAGAVQGADGLV